MKKDLPIIVKALLTVVMAGLIFQNFQGYLLLRQYSKLNESESQKKTSNEWDQIASNASKFIADQNELIEQLNHVMSREGIHDYETKETFPTDVTARQLNTNNTEIYSLEQTWADYEIEDLDYLDSEIFDEQLRRFEESLTQIGRQELDNRVRVLTKQYQTGALPGFEEIASSINFDFLTKDEESLTPRELKYRNEILESFKQTSLIRMHGEYSGN